MEVSFGPLGDSSPGLLRPTDGPPGPAKPAPKRTAKQQLRFDLAAIERALRAVQRDFDRINATLDTPRDPLSDRVIANLLAGYAYLDTLLADGRHPLTLGNSRDLLQLNHLVLCGTDEADIQDSAKHLAETAARFYDTAGPGGIGELMSTLAAYRDEPVWRRAARAYIQVMSRPQLFIEGNHRTGALVMSCLLCREGHPPFVLTVGNAKAYFDPSSVVKGCRKRSFHALMAIPKLRKCLAKLIENEADRRFLTR